MMRSLLIICFAASVCVCSGVNYEITVYTGNLWYSGTDAKIQLTLHGDLGSEKVSLRDNKNGDLFEANSIDRFLFDINDVGLLRKIDVERNDYGKGPGWYLLKIIIKDSYATNEITCNQWIKITPSTFYALRFRCGHPMNAGSRIVGGNEAPKGAWPWQVSIDYNILVGGGNRQWQGHWCGGSIIDNQWIISAAHCFNDDPIKDNYRITVGQHDLHNKDGYEQEIPIEKIIIHENYDAGTNDNDIMLIKLAQPIQYNKRILPVCLPTKSLPTGTQCYISGWGGLKEGSSGPAALHQAKVPLVDQGTCDRAYYRKFGLGITSRMLCAGYAAGGIDSCQGDSGGPLVCKENGSWKLMGAVSWGVGCARTGVYGVYADIVNLKGWLKNNM